MRIEFEMPARHSIITPVHQWEPREAEDLFCSNGDERTPQNTVFVQWRSNYLPVNVLDLQAVVSDISYSCGSASRVAILDEKKV